MYTERPHAHLLYAYHCASQCLPPQGPASITIDIAKRYPSATILGIDGGPAVISQARDAAQKANVHNIRFAVGDALDLAPTASEPGFELVKGSCDVGESNQRIINDKNRRRPLLP